MDLYTLGLDALIILLRHLGPFYQSLVKRIQTSYKVNLRDNSLKFVENDLTVHNK